MELTLVIQKCETRECETFVLDPSSFIDWYPMFINKDQSDIVLKYLLEDVDWKIVPRTNMEGTVYNLARVQNWMADSEVSPQLYQKGDPLPWNELIYDIQVGTIILSTNVRLCTDE